MSFCNNFVTSNNFVRWFLCSAFILCLYYVPGNNFVCSNNFIWCAYFVCHERCIPFVSITSCLATSFCNNFVNYLAFLSTCIVSSNFSIILFSAHFRAKCATSNIRSMCFATYFCNNFVASKNSVYWPCIYIVPVCMSVAMILLSEHFPAKCAMSNVFHL